MVHNKIVEHDNSFMLKPQNFVKDIWVITIDTNPTNTLQITTDEEKALKDFEYLKKEIASLGPAVKLTLNYFNNINMTNSEYSSLLTKLSQNSNDGPLDLYFDSKPVVLETYKYNDPNFR